MEMNKVIETARRITPMRHVTLHQMENRADHGADTVARSVAIWFDANREALNYKGPDEATLTREIAQHERTVAQAQERLRSAEQSLHVKYGSNPWAIIDTRDLTERDAARGALSAARADLEGVRAKLTPARNSLAAQRGLLLILAQIVGQ